MPRAGFFHVTIQDVIEKKGDRPPSPSLPLQSSEEDRVLPTLHELRAGIWKIGRGGRPVPREAARAVLKFFLCGLGYHTSGRLCGERTLTTAQKLSERTNRARIISICPLHNIVGV